MVTSFLYYINYIIAIFFKYAYSQYGTILINVSDFFVNVSRETFFWMKIWWRGFIILVARLALIVLHGVFKIIVDGSSYWLPVRQRARL